LPPSPPTPVITSNLSSRNKASDDPPSSTKRAPASEVTLQKWEDVREQELQRIGALELQLELIESSKNSELDAIRNSLQSQKRVLDAEIRAEETQLTLDDEKLAENRRIIADLKVENDKIRAQNRELLKDVRHLRENNLKLKESLADTTALQEKLQSYHNSTAKTQEKLERKSRWLERSVEELEYQVREVTDYACCERAWRGVYEQAILDLPHLLSREEDGDLSNDVQELSASLTGTMH
jgi:chromosome segregation ATPase